MPNPPQQPKRVVAFSASAEAVAQSMNPAHALKMSRPVGGVAMPPIPPLTAAPISGAPMAQQAEALRSPLSPNSPSFDPEIAQMVAGGQITPDQAHQMAAQRRAQSQMALDDGTQAFSHQPPMQGYQPPTPESVAAQMAQQRQAQEASARMAAGTGQKIPLAQLRPETASQLSALAAAQTPAGAPTPAESVGPPPAQSSPPDAEDPAKDENVSAGAIEKLLMGMDDHDFERVRRQTNSPEYNDKERRTAIESRCEPMSLSNLILYGEVAQIVPIVTGQFFPEFRTRNGKENLAIKQLMYNEQGLDIYVNEKFTMMSLTLVLNKLNGNPLPPHRTPEGVFDEKLFLAKLEAVLRLAGQVLSDLITQAGWFEERVADLLNTDTAKNG